MGFRTVIVNSRCKLECRLNYLIVRGETEKRIFIHEINTLIVQSTAVSLTAALLCELAKYNVKVIFCDEKCNPQTELLPYYGAQNLPPEGIVELLEVTENQFSRIDYLVGEKQSLVEESMDRLIEL